MAQQRGRCHGTAQIPGEQNRTEDRRSRNNVQERRGEQRDADSDDGGLGIAQLYGGLYDNWRFEKFHAAVHEQEQRGQGAHDATCPEASLRDRSGLNIRFARMELGIGFHGECHHWLTIGLTVSIGSTIQPAPAQ